MAIGKTSASLSISELFDKYSEISILTTIFPEIKVVPCIISSPFREDRNPSFSIYLDDNNHVRFKDFGELDCKGSLLDLLCKKWNCSFRKAFDKILEVMQGHASSDIPTKVRQIKVVSKKESSEKKIQVSIRPWAAYDYEYWASYGIEKQWLKHAEIHPISYKIITKRDENNKLQKYIFPADKYAYVFVNRKEGNLSLKIYQPMNTKGYKWCSKADKSVIDLWTKIPERGDKVIIASSMKDALCISCNLHIPALSLQGEGFDMSDSAIKSLKERYDKVYISFDGDTPGKQDAKRLSKRTGFPIIHCPILETPKEEREEVKKLTKVGLQKKDKAKDWSDIFFYFGKERFIEEFKQALLSVEGTKNNLNN